MEGAIYEADKVDNKVESYSRVGYRSTVEPPKKGHFGIRAFGPCREVAFVGMYVTVYSPNEKGVWFNEKGCGFEFGRSRRQLSTEVQRSGARSLAAGRSLEVAVAVVRRFKMC